jgi:hypothetical protein
MVDIVVAQPAGALVVDVTGIAGVSMTVVTTGKYVGANVAAAVADD